MNSNKLFMKRLIIPVLLIWSLGATAQKIQTLDSVTVSDGKKMNSGFTRLRDVEGTSIYAGKIGGQSRFYRIAQTASNS